MHEFMPANALIVLHAWLVHRRLLELGDNGKKLQQDFFDRCWEDTEDRVRKVGVRLFQQQHQGEQGQQGQRGGCAHPAAAAQIMELLVSKYQRQAQEFSFGLMVSLDQAVEEGRRPLVDALMRCVACRGGVAPPSLLTPPPPAPSNVYMGNTDFHAESERLADYVLGESQALHEEPDENVVWGRFVWADPPVERYHRGARRARHPRAPTLPAPHLAWRCGNAQRAWTR